MMTVKEVSKLAGISIRTLQYYDKIGLLCPRERTEAGYRLYDDTALTQLQQIMLFRELEFSLAEIKAILQNPDFDRNLAIEQQITLLTMKKQHLENLIAFACGLQKTGGTIVDFSAFDTKKLDEYTRQAKEQWQHTEAYQAYAEKNKGRSKEMEAGLAAGLMHIFEEFGALRAASPDSPESQELVRRLQAYITEHYYPCTKEILSSLGVMYAAGGEFTENIDKAGGAGTAGFVEQAIRYYCR